MVCLGQSYGTWRSLARHRDRVALVLVLGDVSVDSRRQTSNRPGRSCLPGRWSRWLAEGYGPVVRTQLNVGSSIPSGLFWRPA